MRAPISRIVLSVESVPKQKNESGTWVRVPLGLGKLSPSAPTRPKLKSNALLTRRTPLSCMRGNPFKLPASDRTGAYARIAVIGRGGLLSPALPRCAPQRMDRHLNWRMCLMIAPERIPSRVPSMRIRRAWFRAVISLGGLAPIRVLSREHG